MKKFVPICDGCGKPHYGLEDKNKWWATNVPFTIKNKSDLIITFDDFKRGIELAKKIQREKDVGIIKKLHEDNRGENFITTAKVIEAIENQK